MRILHADSLKLNLKIVTMKSGLKLILGCLILLGIANCSCDTRLWKSGSGNIVEQERQLKDFKGIEAGGAVEVNINQGDSQKVVVITDDNLQEDVKTEVSDNILKIYTEHHLSGFNKLKVNIIVKEIESIELTGASRLYAKGTFISGKMKINLSGASQLEMDIKAIEINSEISGASNLILNGAVGDFKLEASGASKCEGFNLTSANSDVSASGASKISITCDHELKIDASGASTINYRGNAKILKSDVSGASNISKD